MQYTRSDLPPQRVAATSRPTCTNRVSAATCRLFHFMKMGASTFRGPGSKITSLQTSWYGKTDNANFLPTEHCNFTPLVFYPRSFASPPPGKYHPGIIPRYRNVIHCPTAIFPPKTSVSGVNQTHAPLRLIPKWRTWAWNSILIRFEKQLNFFALKSSGEILTSFCKIY